MEQILITNCIGCNRNLDKKGDQLCPVCEFHLGYREDFPSYAELRKWKGEK